MEKYNFYEALKMTIEGRKMMKGNTSVYMCFDGELKFHDHNDELCGNQTIDDSDINIYWTEIIELTPQQIERKAIEQELRETSEKMEELADKLAKLDDIK